MVLPSVLDDLRRRFAPSYGGGLTNHLPMAATALYRLGASEARVQAFIEHHAAHLEPAAPWPQADAMAQDLRSRGIDVVAAEVLGGDLVGLAGAAFHGVIRLAYAKMADDLDETAAALAYLHDSAVALETDAERARRSSKEGTTNDVGVLAEKLRVADIGKPQGFTIAERLTQVTTDARFAAVIDELAVDQTTLAQVSALGARWYLAADDFASLHVLTGAHALRTLRPWTTDPARADRAMVIAALGAYVACGSPIRRDARGLARATDSELKTAAIASNDDHLAKLVVAALDEELAYQDTIYRIVATRSAHRGHT